MERDTKGYDWLEFSYRPLKDGLHDSGYRYIKLVGVTMSPKRDGTVEKEELHQWSDHVLLNGITNIDVQEDGTIRLMCWGGSNGWISDNLTFSSSAIFYARDMTSAIRSLEVSKEIYTTVYEDESMWLLPGISLPTILNHVWAP